MQGIKPETLSDEEFMRYAYLQGLSKLNETWVKQFYDRLQRMIDEKDTADKNTYETGYADGYESGYDSGYATGHDAATE